MRVRPAHVVQCVSFSFRVIILDLADHEGVLVPDLTGLGVLGEWSSSRPALGNIQAGEYGIWEYGASQGRIWEYGNMEPVKGEYGAMGIWERHSRRQK